MENKFTRLDFANLNIGLLNELYNETKDPFASAAIRALRSLALGYEKDAANWLIEGLIVWQAGNIAKEEERKSCPTTGRNEKPLALFKVTLRRALFHNSENKEQLAIITVRFAGNPSQEDAKASTEVTQLTELGRLASVAEVEQLEAYAVKCCREFEPKYPIRWSEDLAVEALVERL